jgi:protein involved in polysaccharide export with SLBB domain
MIDWHSQQYMELKGEVRFPGRYVFKKGETLSSVIKRAGGFTGQAYLKGAVFTRESVKELQQKNLEEALRRLEVRLLTEASGQALSSINAEEPKQIETAAAMRRELINKLRTAKAQGRISIKLDEAEKFNGSSYDVALEDGDLLYVPMRPTQVQIMGAVQNPAAFIFEQDTPISRYIGKAGGYNEEADEGRIFVLKGDGTAMSKSNGSWIPGFMSSKLDPGDTVVVPEKLDKGLWMRGVKDITQILYQIAVTAGVLIVAF